MKEFLFGTRGDMVERGLIMAAIVVAAIFLWVSIGQKLAVKLGIVDSVVGQGDAVVRDQASGGRGQGSGIREQGTH
jgi:hypothetical protein